MNYVVPMYSTCTLILFFCVADQALGHAGLLPTNATVLCAALITPFVVHTSVPNRTLGILHTPLAYSLWANRSTTLSLFILSLVALSLSVLPTSYWGENGKWIAVVPYDAAIAIGSLSLGFSGWITRHLPSIILASLIALAGSIWYDMLHPGTFAEISNRAAGFPGNANFAALTAVVLCSAGLHLGEYSGSSYPRRSLTLDMLILVSTFTVVTMTMSRSGLLNFSMVVSMFIFFRLFRSRSSLRQRVKEVTAATCVIAIASTIIVWLSAASASGNQDNRLIRFLNNQQVDDGSAGTRLAAVHDSIRLIEEAPILGHGTGFSRTMNELPHNMYLQQWVNNGLLGIVAYLCLLGSAFMTFFSRGYRNGQMLILSAAVGGIFSHNVLDLRPFLMLLGIMLSRSYLVQRQRDSRALPVLLQSGPIHSAAPHFVLEDSVTGQ